MTQQVPFAPIFREVARHFNLDPRLLMAVAQQESRFDPQAVSPAGAQGVMQLMPETAEQLGVDDPFDPVQNIVGGAAYLSELMDRFDGDTEKALAGYNWGPNRQVFQQEDWKDHLPEETSNYIPAVMANLEEFDPGNVDTSIAQQFAQPLEQSPQGGDPRRFFSNLTAARMSDVFEGKIQSPFLGTDQGGGSNVPKPQPKPERFEGEFLGDIFSTGGGSSEEPLPPEQEIAPHPQPRGEFPVPKPSRAASDRLRRLIAQRLAKRRQRVAQQSS